MQCLRLRGRRNIWRGDNGRNCRRRKVDRTERRARRRKGRDRRDDRRRRDVGQARRHRRNGRQGAGKRRRARLLRHGAIRRQRRIGQRAKKSIRHLRDDLRVRRGGVMMGERLLGRQAVYGKSDKLRRLWRNRHLLHTSAELGDRRAQRRSCMALTDIRRDICDICRRRRLRARRARHASAPPPSNRAR